MKSIREKREIGEYADGTKGIGYYTDNSCLADTIDAFNEAGVDNDELIKKIAIEKYDYAKRPINTFVHYQWTNDPQVAWSTWTKQQAQEHRDKYFNDPKFKITEHEFI